MTMGALTDEEMRNIGERIARKRGAIGLSQEQFAEVLGLSRAAVGKIERGESAPKADTLITICRVLHSSPNEVLYGSPLVEDGTDPELLAMIEMLKTFTPEQKRQFYMTMNIVGSGIQHMENGFLKNVN